MLISIFCSISFLQLFSYFLATVFFSYFTLVNVLYMVFAGGEQLCTLSEPFRMGHVAKNAVSSLLDDKPVQSCWETAHRYFCTREPYDGPIHEIQFSM